MLWRFGEMLDADGNLTQKNIQCVGKKKTSPLQQIDYTCGEGKNVYKTTFAVFGFRYAEVETDVELLPENIEAIAVYSDMRETGRFESSNELLNRFVEATKWSTKSNSLDIPTDCPTRERHGWTGDAQIFFETASFLFDYAAFSKKYLRDVYDWQKRDGRLPQIAPYGGVDLYMWTLNGSVGWSDIGILLPYRFWKKCGDRQILTEYYDRMKKYAAFMIRRVSSDGVVRKGQSYGEWAEPEDVMPNVWTNTVLPHPEVSTAYTANVLRCLAEIAEELQHPEDAANFRAVSDKCTAAYQKAFGKDLDTDRQALLVRPLSFGLLDEEQTSFAEKRLIEALEHYGWRLGTGFLSTPLRQPIAFSKTRRCPAGCLCRKRAPPPSGRAGRAPRPRAVSPASTTTPRARWSNGCSKPCAASGWTAKTILPSPRSRAGTSAMPGQAMTASTVRWRADGR